MKTEDKDGIAIIVADERLDALVASNLKNAVTKLSDEGKRKILIDMGQTKFIDSAGCGALVASLRVILRNKGDMKVARPSQQVQTLFELTRLHRVFEIFDDMDAAVRSFS